MSRTDPWSTPSLDRGSLSSGRPELVRPLAGRYVAGVCAALGRLTRTDPVLWRVVLGVLACFGGLGVLAYLAVWLLTPEEGDTAAPLEAAFGRGHSSTSPALVVGLSVITVALLALTLAEPFHLILLSGGVLLTFLLWRQRASNDDSPPTPGAPSAAAPSPTLAPPAASSAPEPATSPVSPSTPEAATAQGSQDEADRSDETASPQATDHAADGPAADAPAGTSEPTAAPTPAVGPEPPSPAPVSPTAPPAGGAAWDAPVPVSLPSPSLTTDGSGYRPPFAPYGPFAEPPPPPPPPRPRREKSALAAITFFLTLGVLGLLGLLELSGATDISIAGYLATALVMLGAGLVVGAWFGRARSLIALGLMALLALPVGYVVDDWHPRHPVGTQVEWVPTSVDQLQPEYAISFGEGTLDLRQLDLTGETAEIRVRVQGGEIVVLLPETGEVTVHTTIAVGSADVLGHHLAGVSNQHTLTDSGQPSADDADPDRTDPGSLTLHLDVLIGNIEVTR